MPDDISLRQYFEQRLSDLDRRLTDRFTAADRALEKSETALREYKAASNEWREALKDSASRMVTRAEHDALNDQIQALRREIVTRTEHDALNEQIQAIRREKANFDGRLVILSGGVSIGVSVGLWALSRLLH